MRKTAGPAPTIPSRWPVRVAWLAAVALAFTVPALALAAAADGPDKRAVASVSAFALVGTTGPAAAWKLSRQPRVRQRATWVWLAATAAAGLYLAATGAWLRILWIAAIGWTLAGMALFAWREAADATPFQPDRSGWSHLVLGWAVAATPLLALMAWRYAGL